jgi:transcriptional regulator with XRE-family HTH domain
MTPNSEWGYYADLGRRLRAARTSAGLSQEALGALVGVTGKAVCQWETAVHRMSLFTYRRLQAALGGFR